MARSIPSATFPRSSRSSARNARSSCSPWRTESRHTSAEAFNLPLPGPEPPDREWLRQLGLLAKLGKIFETAVPDWLKDFQVYSSALVYDDVVVEANGTLVINKFVTSLSANNFRMHQGAKVVQESPYLTAEITGELRGDLP